MNDGSHIVPNEASADIEEHVRPNVSRLESHRAEISLARKRGWPYDKIAAHLQERHGLTISDRAVSNFCRCRGIKKGVGETKAAEAVAESRPTERPRVIGNPDVMASIVPQFKRKTVFTNQEGPARTRSNGGLDENR